MAADPGDQHPTASQSTQSEAKEQPSQVTDHEEKVLAAYDSLSSRRVDLIGDYAGNELFIVDGDSLCLECFSHPSLDFENGFQMLHAAYLVLQLLDNLVRRKCNFNIVFFDDNRTICVPPQANAVDTPKYLLMRTALIAYLKETLPRTSTDIDLLTFTSPHDDDFHQYFAACGAYFLMCHDGVVASHATLPSSRAQHYANQKLVLRQMILGIITKGYNVALLHEIEWRDAKAMTVVIQASMQDVLQEHIAPTEENTNNGDMAELVAKLPSVPNASTFEACDIIMVLAVAQSLLHPQSTEASVHAASAVLMHHVIKQELPLSKRCFSSVTLSDELREASTAIIVAADVALRDANVQSQMQPEDNEGLIDLFDGRLLAAMAGLAPSSLTGGLFARHTMLLDAVRHLLTTHDAKDLTIAEPQDTPTATGNGHLPVQNESTKVLPFTNQVFDAHLRCIWPSIDATAIDRDSPASARIFQEIHHWHNTKPLTVKQRPVASARDVMWAMKRNQWYMADMQKYAASLTNAVGQSLEPETIVLSQAKSATVSHAKSSKDTDKKSDTAPEASSKASSKAGKAAAPTKKQAMLNSIAQESARKEQLANQKVIDAWHAVCKKTLALEKDPKKAHRLARDYLKSLTSVKRKVLEAEVRLYMLNCLLQVWSAGCQKNDKALDLAALIWYSAKQTADCSMSKTIADDIATAVHVMQLPPVATPNATEEKRALPFILALTRDSSSMYAIGMPRKEFQLQYCGPYLDRSIDSAPDARVEFDPDGWQRRVLDGIDANKSLLVVAPTSAGKTFISFYAMRQVLAADDDSILVYIAPTKALVNQIAAEIQSRFAKKYKHAGKSVWAIHTRDYRINNPSGCQILVTVPHVLQIMLMSPSNAKTWSPRIKRIIFDEVHSISNADDGLVWEQLLMLAPCPIIALSATIGNVKDFGSWLTSTQQALGNELEVVEHPYRYSDLRCHGYTPPSSFVFEGLEDPVKLAPLGLASGAGFDFIHPVASLINQARGLPDDLRLEPRDCLTLWKAMTKVAGKDKPVPTQLDPEKTLPDHIKRLDTLKWETQLKAQLRSWMLNEPELFRAVIKSLRDDQPRQSTVTKQTPLTKREEDDEEDNVDIGNTTMPLICQLHEQDALPAIFFNYDRRQCENICKQVLSTLEKTEENYKETSTKWKATLKAWEQYKMLKDKAREKAAVKTVKKKTKGQDDENEDRADVEQDSDTKFERFDPQEPLAKFSFADKSRLGESELAEYMYKLRRRGADEYLISALQRGIGVHHSGMNRQYRNAIEVLFRRGFLRIVIATGTLALGINMPCKTVVFSGDSVFLTALTYRQAAGRAGRRGLELLGNVVFQDMSGSKVLRLMSSKLPDLNGHFPITTTLVLRLFSLLQNSGQAPYAIRAINTLLSQPRLYLGGPEFKEQTLHHLRFSIEYLRRQHLLDAGGNPLNFAGMVSHLYFTENSSFAFHALLKEGFFHHLCADISKKEKSTLETLMLVMSHLFGRIVCRRTDKEFRENIVKRSPSLVFLPPLPKDATTVLEQHAKETLQTFRSYVKTFVDQHVSATDNKMPLTETVIGQETTDEDDSAVSKHLQSFQSPPTTIRSRFVALSGHDDHFSSIPDLCQTVRSGVFLEESVIPTVSLSQEASAPLNAYLLDFYKHGDIKTLQDANGIRKSDVWFVLNDFSLVLATIVASMRNFMRLETISDADMLEVQGGMDVLQEQEEDAVVATEQVDAAASAAAAVKALSLQDKAKPKVKKTKTADAWDDEASSEDEGKDAAAGDKDVSTDGATDGAGSQASWDKAGGDTGLLNVLQAFQKLQVEFNAKFKAMWA